MGRTSTSLFFVFGLLNIRALKRKAKQIIDDPILRRWIFGRVTGRLHRQEADKRRPPYLENFEINDTPNAICNLPNYIDSIPLSNIEIILPGETLRLATDDAMEVLKRKFVDTESLLALHRFSWASLCTSSVIYPWVNALWQAWVDKYGVPDSSWAWHPYTTAERLVNLVTFSQQHGLPGERNGTLEVLAAHGPAIYQDLEYFGENSTGNHLANNGRGLFLGGLALGFESWVVVGGKILVEEAERLFGKSGFLREGSSHYHLLATRWYAECWLAARRYGRPEKDALEKITRKAFGVTPHLNLSGTMPLIGDVSPDCPPSYLSCLLDPENSDGWIKTLKIDDSLALNKLRPKLDFIEGKSVVLDGWWRTDCNGWSVIGFVAPNGWSPMPGHGHNDIGGFELHYKNVQVFCDLGRRSYGPAGDQDVASNSHNTLMIDGTACYPPNKSYYDDDFRISIIKKPPEIICEEGLVTLKTSAFSRLIKVGNWKRSWRIDQEKIEIVDLVEGSGNHEIKQYFHTTLPVEKKGDQVCFGIFELSADVQIKIEPTEYWLAYGRSKPATKLVLSQSVKLPHLSRVTLKVTGH